LYLLGHSRTEEFADSVLEKIGALNPTVETYLRDRRDQITAAGALDAGFQRGGRITSQLAESFMNLTRNMRQLGHIGLIQGLNEYLIKRWRSERVGLLNLSPSWKLKSITERMSRQFVEELVSAESKYKVKEILRRTNVHLLGVVATEEDENDTRVVEFYWDRGVLITNCPCRLWQDYGWPCGRAVALLRTAEMMQNEKGYWNWMKEHFYAPFMRTSTLKRQLELEITAPPSYQS
jgi:hypothetical protein